MRLSVPIVQVDAFADAPFQGNPAAVCLLSEAKGERWMQAVAAEMNLSETAFLVPRADRVFDLRWFTPAVEVALCGHATLASAHVLWERGLLGAEEIARFYTKSGELTAKRRVDGLVELDFPARVGVPTSAPEGLADALGQRFVCVARSADDYLVELENEAAVRRIKPDLVRLAKLPVRGVIVTALADDGKGAFDFVSRFFAPAAGVNEDPVTGSAHCCLAPFWGERLGKTEMIGFQASSRGGAVRVTLRGNRVGLAGRAVTVMDGQLYADGAEPGRG